MFRTVIKVQLMFLAGIICQSAFCQIFTNTSAESYNTWNGPLAKTISVSGLASPLNTPSIVLRQVNIDFGDGVNSANVSTFTITLTSPASTTITIASGLGPTSITRLNTKYRDHASLRLISNYTSTKQPFDIGYYRINTANDFLTFNGENPNGTWTVTITEGTSFEISFNRVDLIFGTAFAYNDISASTGNDNCSAAQCLETGTILIGTNNAYADPGPAADPPLTLGACSWNGAKNNSAWFNFKASATTAKFTISGVSNSLQILAFSLSGSCAAPAYALVTSGCPNDALNDTYTSPQYANGCTCNMQLNMSSLTPGNVYYVMVDGNGGAISSFYIEMPSGAEPCNSWLPVELLSFSAYCNSGVVTANWTTAAEVNNDYFTLERSVDGILFISAGTLPGAGNASTIQRYEFVDYEIPSLSSSPSLLYYRLKQTDYDGKYEYFRTVSVRCNSPGIVIYPTLSDGVVFISGDLTKCTVLVYSAFGEKIFAKLNANKIDLSSQTKGIYYVMINTADGLIAETITVY